MERGSKRNHRYKVVRDGFLNYGLIHEFEYRNYAGEWCETSVEYPWVYLTRWGARRAAKGYMRFHRTPNIVEVVE